MKNIKDYLHLYLGATCTADGNEFVLVGVESTDTGTLAYDGTMIDGIHQCWWVENCDFKLFLRPLSDMTEYEERFYLNLSQQGEMISLKTIVTKDSHECFRYLLSKHFDLFGLIESGLAIDKTLVTA